MKISQVYFDKELTGASTIGNIVDQLTNAKVFFPVDKETSIDKIRVDVFNLGTGVGNIQSAVMVVDWVLELRLLNLNSTPVVVSRSNIINDAGYYGSANSDAFDLYFSRDQNENKLMCYNVNAGGYELKNFWYRVGTSGQTLNLRFVVTVYYN